MAHDLLAVLLAWALIAPALVGVGLLAAQLLGGRPGPLECFFLGLAAVLLALQSWHLFFPIDARAAAVVAVAGLFGLWRGREELRRWRRPGWGTVAMVGAFSGWMANSALGPPLNPDSGIYHLTAIRWASEYPVVPGLGNLHPFYGVNHGFFLVAALLGRGPFAGQGHHLANGLLATALCALVARGWRGLFAAGAWAPQAVAEALLLVPLVLVTRGLDLASGSSDVCELVLGAALVSQVAGALTRPPPERSGTWLEVVLLALALSVTKLSGAAATAGALALAAAFGRGPGFARRAVALLVFALVPWSVASVVQSGYLPYPGALFSFPVDWRVPRPVAEQLANFTRGYGRGPLYRPSAPDDWRWMGPRFLSLLGKGRDFLLPLALGLALTVTAFAAAVRRRADLTPLLLVVPPVCSLAFWWCTAPEERYLGIWLWGFAALGGAAVGQTGTASLRRALLGVAVAAVCLASADVLHDGLRPLHTTGLSEGPPVEGAWVTTATGLRVFVPAGSWCWGAPLPCTQQLDPALELRRPGDLGAGFRIAGQ